jgi:HTH-type transcriptional regulator / antitoxin HigA
MSQSELARRMDRPLKTINEIIKGKAAITPETAIQLERALGMTARYWNNLETHYREYLADQQARRELEANASWVDAFPIKDLIHHKLIPREASKADTLQKLLSYFRLSSPAAFDRQWMQSAASFRASPTFMASPQSVAAWLRWGEIEASKAEGVQPFNAAKFRQALKQIRPLTRRGPFMMIFNKVRAMCADAGVVVVLTPELTGTRLSGAARWLTPDRALIQLSLRYKSDDQFWFSFFHEAGHVLAQTKRRDFVDGPHRDGTGDDVEPVEAEADRFSRDWLLPPSDYEKFVNRGDFTAEAVRAFAEEQEIAPGIVVGRLRRDDKIPKTHLTDLKKSINPASP